MLLFVEGFDPAIVVGFNHTEFARLFPRNWIGGHGDIGLLGHVKVDHAADVHTVNMVAAKDCDQVGIGLFYEIDILKNGVGRSLIPGLSLRTHLGRNIDDELALQQAAELPSFTQVLQQ